MKYELKSIHVQTLEISDETAAQIEADLREGHTLTHQGLSPDQLVGDRTSVTITPAEKP